MSKTEFSRNIDSGVFMSDGTDESLLSDGPVTESLEQEPLASHANTAPITTRDYSIRTTTTMSDTERLSRQVIQQCLDDEVEVVDLR